MFLTSDNALTDQAGRGEVPRHFMVISKPCIHPDTAPREGYIRGSYESVEFIREIPIYKKPQKSASTTNLTNHSRDQSSSIGKEAILRNAAYNKSTLSADAVPASQERGSTDEARARGKTISFESSRGSEAKGERVDVPAEDDESECNPIEWIMITRSDPGGSVPRFMVERGTPGAIVSDASKFLNWACAKDIDDYDSDDEIHSKDGQDEKPVVQEHVHHHDHERDLHNYQTNGHLAGLEEEGSKNIANSQASDTADSGGLYGLVAGAAGGAGALIASYTPAIITDHLPGLPTQPSTVPNGDETLRRDSVSTISSQSSDITFASALENRQSRTIDDALLAEPTESTAESRTNELKEKELQKLEERKRRLDEKLSKIREKNSEDNAKQEEAIRKAEIKNQKEVQKQELKYKKEIERLEKRKRKVAEKDERTKLLRELEETRAERNVLRKEKDILRLQVGELQAENTAFAVRIGRMGTQGEDILREVRQEVGKSGRLRASSLKEREKTSSLRSSGSSETPRDPRPLTPK